MRDIGQAIDRHVADSLVVAAVHRDADARSPTSAPAPGWPGLALAAALPDAEVWLVETAIRHCRYLERAIEVSGLTNVSVVNARVEDWSWTGDLVTARALAALPVVLEYAAPLLVEGGRFVAWKGAVSPEEDAAGLVAAEILGLGAARGAAGHALPGLARPHAARVLQDRAHAGALPAAGRDGGETAARAITACFT